MTDAPLRVVQLSDLHFNTSPGEYDWRDTGDTFAAVAAHAMAEPPDMVVVTGDIANQGNPAEYEMAGAALADLGVPVYCLPGNHDSVDSLHAHLPRPGITVQPTLRVRDWLFLFGDSNAGGVTFDERRGWIDTPDRIHKAKGSLTSHELSWLERQLDAASADHAMLWIHHPPGSAKYFEEPGYDDQIRGLAEGAPGLRAVAAGHAHTGITVQIGPIPSQLCPSTGLSVDFEAMTLMPPGYRRFAFWPDGRIDTELVWLDDDRWSDRFQLPPIAAEYLAGRVTREEMNARLARGGDRDPES